MTKDNYGEREGWGRSARQGSRWQEGVTDPKPGRELHRRMRLPGSGPVLRLQVGTARDESRFQCSGDDHRAYAHVATRRGISGIDRTELERGGYRADARARGGK